MKTLTLWYDSDMENPCEWDSSWKVYSFNRRHTSFKDPDYFIADPDIAAKLESGLAFYLSYYEHGLCQWSLQSEGPTCQWDSVRTAGLIVWENDPSEIGGKTYEDRANDARAFLETYTKWCNGEGYGYTLEETVTMPCGHTETNLVDSCGGFYDPEGMFDEIKANLKGEPVTVIGEAKYLADRDTFASVQS